MIYFYIMNKLQKTKKVDIRRIHVNLSDEVHWKLRVKCALMDATIQQFVANLIANADLSPVKVPLLKLEVDLF
jgi:hypothetical protein